MIDHYSYFYFSSKMVSKVQQNILNLPLCPDPPHLRCPQEFHQCSLCLPYPQSGICVSANKTTGELCQSVSFWINEYLICHSAHCVLCAVYFSAQQNKLRPILKRKKYYLIEIYFSQLVRVRRKKTLFLMR